MNKRISVSEAKLHRYCRKAHDYKYRQRLAPKRPAMPLLRGNIGHAMLDAKAAADLKLRRPKAQKDPERVLLLAEKDYNKLFAEEKEKHGDVIGDLRRIFAGYWRRWNDEPLKVLGTEEEIETDLGGGYTFLGYIDKRYQELKTGLRWLTDHKFKKKIPGPDDRFSDFQLVAYSWAWNREHPGDKVDGVMWDYLRSKAPTVPETLVRGGLTKRKDIDTDEHTYRAEIDRLQLDPGEYKEILGILAAKPNTFFARYKLPHPSKHMVDEVVKDLKTEAVLIHRLGTAQITRNMSYACPRCDFFKLCQAELRGLDAAFVRKSEFIEKEPTNGKEISEEE